MKHFKDLLYLPNGNLTKTATYGLIATSLIGSLKVLSMAARFLNFAHRHLISRKYDLY